MRDELEQMAAKHAMPWVIAIVAVAVSKMYSTERATVAMIARSLLAATLISFLLVESTTMSRSTLFVTIAIAAALTDAIVMAVLGLGDKIRQDPSIITKYLPWGPKK